MSQENVEVVRAVIDGWLREDPATMELVSEDAVYVAPSTMLDGRTYLGHEGVLRWVADWRQAWIDIELEIERIEALGDQVLTIERQRGTGRRSGVAVDMQTVSLWTVRDGKIARWQGFPTEAEALEAVGLRE